MTKLSSRFLTFVVAFFVSLSCSEPTAPGPGSGTQALPSFHTTLEEVAAAAKNSGRHEVRNGNDVWVLDVATASVRVNGKKVRVHKKDISRLAEIFDRFASFDRFYEALHQHPEYLKCVEAAKKNPLRRASLKATPMSQGGSIPASLRMSSLSAAPTNGATQSVTIPVYLTGIDCESLNATWREQYGAYTQLKDSWFQRMGETLVGAFTEDQLTNPDLMPLSYAAYLEALAVEAVALLAELKIAELTLNMTQVLMASYGCITTLPPVNIPPSGSGGGGGCEVHLMQFLISYDGGNTWHVVSEWYEYRNCD